MFFKCFFILSFLSIKLFAQYENDECVLKHDQSPGICKRDRTCPEVVKYYNRGIPFTTCSYIDGLHIVCCPLNQHQLPKPQILPVFSNNKHRSISADKCDEYKKATHQTYAVFNLAVGSKVHDIDVTDCDVSTGLIVGGVKTKKGEFPHMAAIGYRTSERKLEFKCGGSLISENFVLTVAHCYTKNPVAVLVRLGDQNILNRSDGLVELDINIAEFIVHENYNRRTKQNDIALIRLSRPVEKFTKFIRPACLWQSNNVNVSTAVATGWGYTQWQGSKISEELLKVELNIIELNQCNSILEDDDVTVTKNQICAGVLTGGKDTCQGDSGGPLQVTTPDNNCAYHIIGLTSFGAVCGGLSPSIYTRVSSYLNWIEEKVWK